MALRIPAMNCASVIDDPRASMFHSTKSLRDSPLRRVLEPMGR